MGFFRFRRSFRIAPGLRLNIGKRSTSVSVGVRGAHVTFGKAGTRTTVGVPGTGLLYTDVTRRPHQATVSPQTAALPSAEPTRAGKPSCGWLWILLCVAVIAMMLIGVMR